MDKTESNQKRIYRSLLANIRNKVYPEGEFLPSLRKLAKIYFSTPGTVRQALMKLQDDGLITAHQGLGYCVNVPKPQSKKILILEQTKSAHLYGNFLSELCACIQEYPEYAVLLEDTIRYKNEPEKLYERLLLFADQYEAIFFDGYDVRLPAEAFSELKKRTKLFYYFDANANAVTVGIPGVSTDWNHGMYIGVRHLIDCGCRRILVHTGWNVSSDGAFAAVKDSCKDVELILSEDRLVDFYKIVESETFDGVYSSQDIVAVRAIAILRKRGFKIPGDIAVIGYYNTPWCEHPFCPLTSISINEKEMIRKTFDMFLQNKSSGQIFVLPSLAIRNSTTDFIKNKKRKEI
ncbi:MAG: GntR family transcriptional regulator [Lentisphaerae bacterium]|nr:GntR family transcriptional regulator [Lentisphaerota bacterium]